MPDESSMNDALAAGLQSSVDRKLTAGEGVLMSLAGAHGEALVATDRRVMIVREQMPIVASETEVDCFDYPYDQIHTVRVDAAVGGGHLKLVLLTPPVDDKEVTLYFPHYDLAKFDAAAARIRLLVEQTRSVPVGQEYATHPSAVTAQCLECGEIVERPEWNYCAKCGAERGGICAVCFDHLPTGAGYCTHCGAPAAALPSRRCSSCSRLLSPRFVYCPSCGTITGPRCPHCGMRAGEGWDRCAYCGTSLNGGSIPTTPQQWQGDGDPPSDQALTAEEHNSEGKRLYNREDYAEAAGHFREALAMDPENGLYHCNLAVALAELGEDDAALAEYEHAIRLAPDDASLHLNLGYYYSEREKHDDAVRAWRRVIELAPDSPEAAEARQNLSHVDEV